MVTVNLDDANWLPKSSGGVAAGDRRGNNGIKDSSPINARSIPSFVQNCESGLATMGAGGRDGCRGALGTTFCLRFFFLPFDFLDIGLAKETV